MKEARLTKSKKFYQRQSLKSCGSILKIFEIVLASFQVENALEKARFF